MCPLSHRPIPPGSPARRLAFVKPGLVCLLVFVTLVAAVPAFAQTVPMPGEEPIPSPWPPTGPEGARSVAWPTGRVNCLLPLHRTVQFLETWQNRVPGVDFGGEIEAEGERSPASSRPTTPSRRSGSGPTGRALPATRRTSTRSPTPGPTPCNIPPGSKRAATDTTGCTTAPGG